MSARVAVVTGGGGAICGAIARGLARGGDAVAIWDLAPEAAERAAAGIRASGGNALAVSCDVLDRAAVKEALERTEAVLGSVDVLVNGAGGSRKVATTSPELRFFDILPDDLMGTLALNYLSAVLPAQAVGRGFAARGRGVVLNIASIAGIRPLTRSVAYSNGKAALVSFTQWLAVHMAREYSPAIRVNALAPGFVLTEQNRFLLVDEASGGLTDRGRQVVAAVPMARYAEPEEMVGAALWLLSDAASYVTGAVVPVDGGLTASAGV
jgi:NAD(P)-dependent dehydrogenase (short-subunit alcohol dehydrogenase family)